LPSDGTLKLSGTPVTANDEILVANIGSLTYDPPAGYSGSMSFTWNGYDGTDYAASAATVNLAIQNRKPILTKITINNCVKNTNFYFQIAQFTDAFSDPDADTLWGMKIVTLPGKGAIDDTGRRRIRILGISEGYEVPKDGIQYLQFVPQADWTGTTSFTWNANDGSGNDYADSDATVEITCTAPNTPPTLTDISKSGNKNTKMGFADTDFKNA
jgi:hypothetical protein